MRRMFSEKQIEKQIEKISDEVTKELLVPYIKLSSVVAVSQLTSMKSDDEYYAQVAFNDLSDELYNRIKKASAIIFTMNNSFVLTPLASTNPTRACGSFAYNELGESMVARMSFILAPALELEPNRLIINFDEVFAKRVYESEIKPNAFLLLME